MLSMFLSDQILWNNRRNIQYIKKLNPKKVIRLVDNKYKTKQFLLQRGIPVWETYAILKNRQELFDFDFAKIADKEFVVKPNLWSKGKWIFLVKRLQRYISKPLTFSTRLLKKIDDLMHRNVPSFSYWYKISGKKYSDREFKKKLLQIIEGNYNLNNRSDAVLVEEKLIPSKEFTDFCEFGLADIRVIVANLVPMMAMLRMPTKASWGKANLAQGGAAFGIDLPTGKIISFYQYGKLYTSKFPEKHQHLYMKKIPFWDDILLHSSNIQYFVNLWFIGIDWVITKDGPKVLELNGKSGMEIQNVNGVWLEQSLQKIIDLDITTPKKWVEVMKSLFSPKKNLWSHHTKVVYLSQSGRLSYEHKGMEMMEDVIVESNLKKKRNYISPRLAKKINWGKHIKLNLLPSNLDIHNLSLYSSEKVRGSRIELGTDTLSKYYVKPVHKSHIVSDIFADGVILPDELDELQILDQKIYDIGKELILSKYLKPTNYLDQFDKFVSHKGRYNPIFTYDFPKNEQFLRRETGLQKLRDEHKWGTLLHSPFAKLLYEKIEELKIKLNLLKAYKKQDFAAIEKYNLAIFGEFDPDLLDESVQKIDTYDSSMSDNFWETIPVGQMTTFLESELKKRKITGVRIEKRSDMNSKISVVMWNQPKIKLLNRAVFREKKLPGVLAHEIDTHLARFLNGRKTGWHILRNGTAFYLRDEEGLAIWRQDQAIGESIPGYDSISKYKAYLLAKRSGELSFAELGKYLLTLPSLNSSKPTLKAIFSTVSKYKRWVKRTSTVHSWAIFLKNKVYLDGYKEIKSNNKKNLELLSSAKISIKDLDIFRK